MNVKISFALPRKITISVESLDSNNVKDIMMAMIKTK